MIHHPAGTQHLVCSLTSTPFARSAWQTSLGTRLPLGMTQVNHKRKFHQVLDDDWHICVQAHCQVWVQVDEERHPGGRTVRWVHRLRPQGSPSLRSSLRADLERVSLLCNLEKKANHFNLHPFICLSLSPGSSATVATRQQGALGRRTGSQRSASRPPGWATTSRPGWTTSWGRRRQTPAMCTSGWSSLATSKWRSSLAWSTGQRDFTCAYIQYLQAYSPIYIQT